METAKTTIQEVAGDARWLIDTIKRRIEAIELQLEQDMIPEDKKALKKEWNDLVGRYNDIVGKLLESEGYIDLEKRIIALEAEDRAPES